MKNCSKKFQLDKNQLLRGPRICEVGCAVAVVATKSAGNLSHHHQHNPIYICPCLVRSCVTVGSVVVTHTRVYSVRVWLLLDANCDVPSGRRFIY